MGSTTGGPCCRYELSASGVIFEHSRVISSFSSKNFNKVHARFYHVNTAFFYTSHSQPRVLTAARRTPHSPQGTGLSGQLAHAIHDPFPRSIHARARAFLPLNHDWKFVRKN